MRKKYPPKGSIEKGLGAYSQPDLSHRVVVRAKWEFGDPCKITFTEKKADVKRTNK